MRKIILFVLMIITVCMFGQRTIFAQSGVSLEVEIKNIEAAAAKQGISAMERHDALVSLARLRQLSGDIEGAAINWFEAAAAIPEEVDDDALLSCAYCLSAMGEWDRAITALEPLLSKSQRARFLDICIKTIKTGDSSTLDALADNPEYSEMKSQIIFMLWKISRAQTAEKWRQRLIAESPQTPEGRLASGQSSSSVIVSPSPFWLFAGGFDSLPILASEKPSGTTAAQTTTAAQAASVAQTSQPPVQQPAVSQASASTARLQTGIYSRQINAQAQITNLRQAGFSPSIEQRVVNGNEMWAVTVSAGTDQARTIRELREAGFESFPVK
jgi:tetratricopeptide (TPR) repeat protein